MTRIRIVGWSDAAFTDNRDLKSQLGRIILFMDDSYAAITIIFKIYKSRRRARSVFSMEVIVFADLFDDVLALRSQIEHALCRAMTMHLLTDSNSLFDIISKGIRRSEKRVMLDIYAAREGHKYREISNLGFVLWIAKLADGLNKEQKQRGLF